MLAEAEASVRAQTVTSWEHLILVDEERHGCAATINKIAKEACGEWFALLADDDLFLPGFLRVHLSAPDWADIVYSPPIVVGEDHQQFHGAPPNIPSTCLVRADLWRACRGYNLELAETEDRDFYQRAQAEGARFFRADEPCWIYRFHPDTGGGNKSRTHP